MENVTLDVIKWCAAEVSRQKDGPEAVPPMIVAWMYAAKIFNERRTFNTINEEDIHYLGGMVNGMMRKPYRDTEVTFASGGSASKWHEIKRQMALLLMNQHDLTTDEFCKRFLDIHPFEDGNGRVAALLWNIKNRTIFEPQIMPDYYKVE